MSADPGSADGERLPSVIENGSDIDITFHRGEASLTYTVEKSSDLINWTTHVVDPGSVGRDVTVSVANSGKLFLRLRVDN